MHCRPRIFGLANSFKGFVVINLCRIAIDNQGKKVKILIYQVYRPIPTCMVRCTIIDVWLRLEGGLVHVISIRLVISFCNSYNILYKQQNTQKHGLVFNVASLLQSVISNNNL